MNMDIHHGGFANHDFSFSLGGSIPVSFFGSGILAYDIKVLQSMLLRKRACLVWISTSHSMFLLLATGPLTVNGSNTVELVVHTVIFTIVVFAVDVELTDEPLTGKVLLTIVLLVVQTVVFTLVSGAGANFLLSAVKVETISHGIFNTCTLPFSFTFNRHLASSVGLYSTPLELPDDA